MSKRTYTCAACGAEFPNLRALSDHKAECPVQGDKSVDDNPAESDEAATGSPPNAHAPSNTPTEVVIPWSHLNPIFQVLGGAAPVRFEGYGYVSDAGLRVAEVRVARRR